MILLTRLNRAPLLLNSDLIEHIEAAPDTVVSLLNGQKLLVLETPEEIVDRVIQFRRAVMAKPFPTSQKGPLNELALAPRPLLVGSESQDFLIKQGPRGMDNG